MHSLRNTAAGFLYQHVELWLYAYGCATRWFGGVKPREANPDFIIGTAFGKPMKPAVREAYEFRRRSLDEMSKGADLRLETARLTSSRMNGQSWYYIVGGSKIHTYYKPSLGGILGKVYNLTDLVVGIPLCHLAVAGEYEGRSFRLAVYQGGIPTPPNEFAYAGIMK